MKNYQELCHMVESGLRFKIDFARRFCRVGTYIVFNGEASNNYDWSQSYQGVRTPEMFVEVVEDLYNKYKHSRPSERSEGRNKMYFRALPEHELEDDDMLYGVPRELARFQLEFEIVKYFIAGFTWDEDKMGKWFWQSKQDKDLVILRQWFETNNK